MNFPYTVSSEVRKINNWLYNTYVTKTGEILNKNLRDRRQ